MPIQSCNACSGEFYAKPSHIQKGWGKFCSKPCQYTGQSTGEVISCETCCKRTYKNITALRRSVSGKLFCSKTCQTVWRNRQYTQDKHPNWVAGQASYRKVLMRDTKRNVECEKCHALDQRILAVHHKDKNRNNNSLGNLIWLCHNCHYLIHHFSDEATGYIVA